MNFPAADTAIPIGLEEFAARLGEISRVHLDFNNVFCTTEVDGSNGSRVSVHVVRADGNGRPQIGLLVRSLCNAVIDYCIPRKRIERAHQHYVATGTTTRIAALQTEARRTFTDLALSGEGGELLLFALVEGLLKYPQVLSKMSLKTSARMHVHGMDGLYVSCRGAPPRLRLHFGESKLHRDMRTSINEGVASVREMLHDEGHIGSSRRDFYLLEAHGDLGDVALEEALTAFLDPADSRFMAPEVCAVLLTGYELDRYPIVKLGQPFPETLLEEATTALDVLGAAALLRQVDSFKIDVLCIPFPSVQEFRDAIALELGLR